MLVSIPFIAGQWSLLYYFSIEALGLPKCFNPLHCGAVVASLWQPNATVGRGHVSIPFIAGQWSLRVA